MRLSILKPLPIYLSALLVAGIGPSPSFAKGTGALVDRNSLSSCGDRIDSKHEVFDTKDFWHGLSQCLRSLRDVWGKQGPSATVAMGSRRISVRDLVRQQIVFALSQPNVLFFNETGAKPSDGRLYSQVVDSNLTISPDIVRVAMTNTLGVPYNAMGQSGFAYFLYQFSMSSAKIKDEQAERDAAFYRAMADFSVNTILKDVDEGGLATHSTCGESAGKDCVWFHSVTRRDLETKAGGTLNQNLHVIRDLGLIADLLQKTHVAKEQEYAARLDLEIAAGINQLFLSKGHQKKKFSSPNLNDFLTQPVGSDQVQWLFYGFNLAADEKGGGYFLGSKGRDCSYHIHVLNLLDGILARAERKGMLPQEYKSCSAPAAAAYRTISIVNSTFEERDAWTSNDKRDYQCNSIQAKKPWNPKFLNKLYGSCALNSGAR